MKRGIGRHVYDFFEARLLSALRSETNHTLLADATTWEPFANQPARKGKIMREADDDALCDARANRHRCGLLADLGLRLRRLPPGDEPHRG